ncbi:MAG: hypothetical protein RIT28_1817 [Pseudomonadota bacterium]
MGPFGDLLMNSHIPLLALFAVALPGCVIQVHSAEDNRELDEAITAVSLDLDSGGVTVMASDAGAVSVYRRAEWSAVPPEMSLEVVDGVLILTSACTAGQLVCRAEHELHLPPGVRVEGVVGSGGFFAEGFIGDLTLNIGSGGAVLEEGEGAVTLDIGSGGVVVDGHVGEISVDVGSGGAVLSEVSGDLNLFVSSGGVVADGLTSTSVVAEVSSGGLSLDFDARPTLIDGDVSSGGAQVTVPAGAYRLELSADSGGVSVDGVQDDPESDDVIRLNVSSGGISLEGDDDDGR